VWLALISFATALACALGGAGGVGGMYVTGTFPLCVQLGRERRSDTEDTRLTGGHQAVLRGNHCIFADSMKSTL
jgi:hypothetical protein